MRTVKAAVVTMTIILSGQSQALNLTGSEVISATRLLEQCNVPANDPIYNAAMGFCLGYIDAAIGW